MAEPIEIVFYLLNESGYFGSRIYPTQAPQGRISQASIREIVYVRARARDQSVIMWMYCVGIRTSRYQVSPTARVPTAFDMVC
jgi:hypothetical protein